MAILDIVVSNISEQTSHILLTEADRSSVVDEEDAEAELAEEHDHILEVGGDDGVGAAMGPDYQRNLRARPGDDHLVTLTHLTRLRIMKTI